MTKRIIISVLIALILIIADYCEPANAVKGQEMNVPAPTSASAEDGSLVTEFESDGIMVQLYENGTAYITYRSGNGILTADIC